MATSIQNFMINIKSNDFYKDILKDVEERFGTKKSLLLVGKNKKVAGTVMYA